MAFILLFLFLFSGVNCLNLEEVFILSRHNLRTPLTDSLQKYTPFQMPKWDTQPGYLTPKGVMLEEYMGEYFSEWFKAVNFIVGCPSEEAVFVYSNNKQRTIGTGKAFARSAFKNCTVKVYHKRVTADPVFNPIVTNSSEIFKELYLKDMQECLKNSNLKEAFTLLGDIIDINNSEVCRTQSICTMDFNNEIIFEVGEEPNIFGPLSIGNSLMDAFLMKYYSGANTDDIAWGKINTQEQWKELLEITWEDQNVRFNTSQAHDIAQHMLKLIKNNFLEDNLGRKLTVLVGHDSNLNCILAALKFKKYNLTGQFEKTPIGGKIVFQKWRENNYYLLKVEYVYQTMDQLRNCTKLSLENPPKSVVLELSDCKIDDRGFCPWTDFVKILKKIN